MCAPVSIGEMSVSLPPFEIFSPKKEMETLFACTGEGGVGEAAGGNEREREGRGGARTFTSGFALWALSLEEKVGRGPVWIYWQQEEDREVTASRKVRKEVVSSVT